MPFTHSARSLPRWSGSAVIAALILCFAPQAGAGDLRIDGSSVSRGAGGVLDVIDARLAGEDVDLEAGRLLHDPEAGFIRASGGVRITGAEGMLLTAEQATWRIDDRLLSVPGEFSLQDGRGTVIDSRNLSYSLRQDSGSADAASILFSGNSARVAAAAVRFQAQEYVLEDASYTTCKTDDPDWTLIAGSLAIDSEDEATAANMLLIFKSVPVFYFPYLVYPVSNRRKSGFLQPSARLVGSGKSELDIPYYLNLAPSYDMVIGTRMISERGPLLHASGRLLGHDGDGRARVGYIDDSNRRQGRYGWSIDNRLGRDGASLVVRGEGVSDDDYPVDFDEGDATAQRHFLRSASLGWQRGRFAVGMLMDGYQTIAERPGEVIRPYARLPELSASFSGTRGGAGFELDVRFTDFMRDEGAGSDAAGSRISAGGNVRMHRSAGAAGVDLAAGVRGASYGLEGADNWLSPFAAVGLSYEMERSASFAGTPLRQSLVPRLFVGVLPRRDFSASPVYDTARADLSVEHMYEVNPFVGGDRFGDASFVTFGLETGAWDARQRRQLFEARFAQRYLLADSRVSAGRRPAPESGLSNALADMRFFPSEHLSMVAQLEWNPDESWERGSWEGKFIRSEDVYALRYTFSRDSESDDEGMIGASILHRIDSRVQLLADFDYSVEREKVTAFVGGLQTRASCDCWRLDLVLRRELIGDGRSDSEILIQLSLNGLTDLGSGTYAGVRDEILEQL